MGKRNKDKEAFGKPRTEVRGYLFTEENKTRIKNYIIRLTNYKTGGII